MEHVLGKGQEDHWFGSAGIRWAFVIMVIGLIAFLIRDFTRHKPRVNPRALTNKNLAIGSALVFILGAAIYPLTSILPVFFQTLMKYDATSAGLAVSPRGLGSIVAAFGVGVLISKLDPRKVVATGFTMIALSTIWLGHLTVDISPTTLFWPITLGGFGMSMVFIPLSNVALGTIPKAQVGNASGIFNFVHNIGGSIGISAAKTIAQRHLQSHRNENSHWLSGASWILQRELHSLAMRMQIHVGGRQARLVAGLLNVADRSQRSVATLGLCG